MPKDIPTGVASAAIILVDRIFEVMAKINLASDAAKRVVAEQLVVECQHPQTEPGDRDFLGAVLTLLQAQ